MDRRKEWRAAERLLKQGKVQAALDQIRKISDGGFDDTITLNRLADLLAQQGKPAEAIGYYAKIARRFEDGGFAPKAIAIHKKILRLDSDSLESAIRLGHLYGRQNLHGEARKYLLHAANRCLEAKELDRASEVFEQLVEVEPDEPRHRVRLAETRAARGDNAGAVGDLVTVGGEFLERGNVEEAARIFGRARELGPESDGALLGAARCHEATGAVDKALEMLETRVGAATAAPELLGELARIYDGIERRDDAVKLLEEATPYEVPNGVWVRMFDAAAKRGDHGDLWARVDPLLGNLRGFDPARLANLLVALTGIEADGHIPALKRLADHHEDHGQVRDAVRTLDQLARAYQARSMDAEGNAALERMRATAPPDEEPRVVVAPPAQASEAGIQHTSLVTPAATPPAKLPLEAEAPAVPLNPGDEEFVSGRLTQAEVLEKYDLDRQALDQLEEVFTRFPGYVPALERRVELIRRLADADLLAAALADLAVGRRAAGDRRGAVEAACEAGGLPTLPARSRALLERLDLLAAAAGTPTASTPAPAPSRPTPPLPSADVHAEAAESTTGSAEEIVIDLDEDEADRSEVSTPPAESRPGPTSGRSAPPELLEETRDILRAGQVADARRRLDALIMLGYTGPDVDALRNEIETRASPATPRPTVATPADDTTAIEPPIEELPLEPGSRAADSAVQPDRVTPDLEPADEIVPADPAGATSSQPENDLDAIRAALEQELAAADDGDLITPDANDESVEDILSAFRERVDEEVEAGDHRTHYELGIGYKEMGLTDEAIHEFQRAAEAAELHQEACAMIAMCHKDREDTDEAIRWYRAALDGAANDSETTRALRYDLADVLLASGDARAALDQFRDLLEVDPGFRDVSGRVSAIERQLQS